MRSSNLPNVKHNYNLTFLHHWELEYRSGRYKFLAHLRWSPVSGIEDQMGVMPVSINMLFQSHVNIQKNHVFFIFMAGYIFVSICFFFRGHLFCITWGFPIYGRLPEVVLVDSELCWASQKKWGGSHTHKSQSMKMFSAVAQVTTKVGYYSPSKPTAKRKSERIRHGREDDMSQQQQQLYRERTYKRFIL